MSANPIYVQFRRESNAQNVENDKIVVGINDLIASANKRGINLLAETYHSAKRQPQALTRRNEDMKKLMSTARCPREVFGTILVAAISAKESYT
jgi:hypothetical protein